jgi:hypothetical protein
MSAKIRDFRPQIEVYRKLRPGEGLATGNVGDTQGRIYELCCGVDRFMP